MTSKERHLTQHLDGLGLCVLGHFALTDPEMETWQSHIAAPQSLALIGHVGDGLEWLFQGSDLDSWPENPLDQWTQSQLAPLAKGLGAHVVYPFQGPPWHPFQQWAERAQAGRPSPLGLLIHPQHGLWFAFRAALVLPFKLSDNKPADAHPCSTCQDKPCLNTCPVSAFDGKAFAMNACRSWLGQEAGASCRDHGCLARQACPVAAHRPYGSAQQRFHLAHFAKARWMDDL